jgi:hypothetical protein
MVGSTGEYNFKTDLFKRILRCISTAVRKTASFMSAKLLPEDIKYNIYFHRSFIPGLYKRHSAVKNTNCLFCRHLIKSEYHRYCLICSKGTYDNCFLPLPDMLFEGFVSPDSEYGLQKPWYFMKTCSSFERLPKKQYSRNLYFPFSSITIHNKETLEGLENGIVYGIRPCHICASADYDLYRKCTRQGDYDIYSPCPSIRRELEYVYEGLVSTIRPAG